MGVLADACGDALHGDENTFLFSLALGSIIVVVGTFTVVVFVLIAQCILSNLEES